jgi:hypothetical protein
MEMNRTILLRFALAMALTGVLSSCYREDMTDCADPRGNVHLSLRLTDGVEGRAARLGDFDITGARVWAFDSAGRMVFFVPVRRGVDGRYEAWMDLPAGRYDFVAWTGNGSIYKVAGTSSVMDKMLLFLDRPYDAAITEMIPDLLYGRVYSREVVAAVDNDIEVDMSPDTYNINVTARGLERDSDIWEVSIYKSGTRFLFNHDLLHDNGIFHHMRSGTPTADGRFSASMRIVAPGADGNPRLVLRNASSGDVRYDRSLVDTIIDAYAAHGQTIDFEHTYIYDIELTFDRMLGVTVSVNGWEHQIEPTDLE